MTEPTKINFTHSRIQQLDDITDLLEILFPGNRNQQHAAGRILLTLKQAGDIVNSLSSLEDQYNISRRTLQRTRAKLSRLGLIEHVSWMNSRYGGRHGWRLSGRMSTALRRLADIIDRWRGDTRPGKCHKEEALIDLLS
jgi:DNA-binding IscR family transcriptional regulator